MQFRQVQCTIPILESQAAEDGTGPPANNINILASPVLVVDDKQCEGERPSHVQECHKICTEGKYAYGTSSHSNSPSSPLILVSASCHALITLYLAELEAPEATIEIAKDFDY